MLIGDQVCSAAISAEAKILQELTELSLKKIRAIQNPQTLNNPEQLAMAMKDLFSQQNQLNQFKQSHLANAELVSQVDNMVSRMGDYITLVRFRQSAVSAKEKLQEAHHVLSVGLFGRECVDAMPKMPAEKQVRRLSF